MDAELMRKLREQTVQICDSDGDTWGTGFFVSDNLVVSVHHCIFRDDGSIINPVSLYRGSKKVCDGIPVEYEDEIVFIFIPLPNKQEDRLPIGYCNNLEYDDRVDVYGYPRKQPEGYPLDRISISGNFYEDENIPSIQILVKNIRGALDQYDGLSGSPMVVENCIVGIAATADESRLDTNALHFYDFSRQHTRKLFQKMGISLKEVFIAKRNGKKNRNMATRMSLYRRAWWITESTDMDIILCDQYSIVLGTLLLAVTSNADFILASPWERGLAQCLQDETQKYEREIPCWAGRRWIEYEDGEVPDWEQLGKYTGVVVSVSAQNCTDVLFSGLLAGRRRLHGDVLVLWNIWSNLPDQSVCQAVRVAGQLEGNAKKDLLTVFSSWQTEEKSPYTFLVQETACEWLKKQSMDYLIQESFLLGLRPEETDIITWEVFRQYKINRTEAWDGVLRNLWQICSDSVKTLISFCEGKRNLEDLLETEPSALKRWFALVKEEDCNEILACLRNNLSLYWNAILINPYCTGYVLQEWCEQGIFVQLLLEQDTNGSNDVLLQDEIDAIRRQIRPI